MAFRRPRRQARYQKLLDAGFLRFEAYTLSRFTHTKEHFYKEMVKERKALLKDSKEKGISKKLFRKDWIKSALYERKGWLISTTAKTRRGLAGTPDPWALLKDSRERDVAKGDYIPDRHKKRDADGYRIHKGNMAAQRRRRRERQRGQRDE
ncbi:hypothetical protein LCGC14_0480860 [marine sediment metagenome]|uniref:Uncharacterized protein n=1 Tax=marine sediment metagenome TaxID=412755 RepID=A0A0F9SSI3_9ZZZZ